MHRLSCARAGLILGLSAAATEAGAQNLAAADTTKLPPVEVTAPQPRRVAASKPKANAERSRRSSRRAVATAATAGSGNPAASAGTGAPAPLMSSSERNVSGAEVNAWPFSRPAEALEVVPGLIVTQHSGDGKANQYFLRGFNLDHGTDLALYVDGMPVNMRTHAHGQGYADLNFLIPELIGSVNIRKGPYFADEGDFSSVGAVHINLLDSIKTMASMTIGSFGYRRGFGVTSTELGEGTLLVAGEAGTYNGPWDNPDNLRKLNGVMRYSQGTATDGFTLTGMAYANRWNSTDQVPARAISSGEIGLYGALDPSDGGNSNRFSLSGNWAQSDAGGSSKANFYIIKSSLNLWNNFTYFLSDPVNGDQFHQHDDRMLGGINASHTFVSQLYGLPVETEIGVQSRYDDIKLDLSNTLQRQFLSPIRSDAVQEGSVGVFAQNTLHWTDWLRTVVGWRGDFYDTSVQVVFYAGQFRHRQCLHRQPEIQRCVRAVRQDRILRQRGRRVSQQRRARRDHHGIAHRRLAARRLAVSGQDQGRRSRRAHQDRSGADQRGQPVRAGLCLRDRVRRRRRRYRGEPAKPPHRHRMDQRIPAALMADLEADIAVTHARLSATIRAGGPVCVACRISASQIGNAPGNYIPGAPNMIASAGITLGEKTGWFGALRYRYFGPRPLTEDGAFVSPATGLFNGRIGYRFDNGWRVQLDGFNMLDSRTDQITYAYGSLIKPDSLFAMCFPAGGASTVPTAVCQTGVMDRVLHPVEPLAICLTLAGQL